MFGLFTFVCPCGALPFFVYVGSRGMCMSGLTGVFVCINVDAGGIGWVCEIGLGGVAYVYG